MDVPSHYSRLDSSERRPARNARKIGPADPNEKMSVSIRVRRQPGAPALPSLDDWARTPIRERKYLSRKDLSSGYGAAKKDLDAIIDFAKSAGLTVDESSAARRTVVVSGTVQQMSQAFAVELSTYQTPQETYRGRDGHVHVPSHLIGVVEGVFGLDNRRMAKRHNGQFDGSPLTPPQVAGFYNFPSTAGGGGQTIGILEFASTGAPAGYTAADIKSFFDDLGLSAPTTVDVSIDGTTNSPGNPAGADTEVALDIDVAGSVARGATLAIYFAPWTQQGWVDVVTTAVHDATNEPTVLSISYGWPEFETADGLDWTQAAMNAVSTTFLEAAAIGVTVFAATGDYGSDCGMGDGVAHVLYPSTDPGVTACGGTSVQYVSGNSFTEVVWTSTGGGISTNFSVPTWQQGANIPVSANPGGTAGRGVPDIAGNADPNSGYNIYSLGSSQQIGGTSAVCPLYAGLVALLNAELGTQIGFLNPSLYSLAGTNVLRDINDGSSNASGGAPGYVCGPGWDGCTGLGVVDGQALLTAISGGLEKKLSLVTDKSTFGKDEVFTTIETSTSTPQEADFPQSILVLVDGFTPDDLGISKAHPSSTELTMWAPVIATSDPKTGNAVTIPGMTITPALMLLEDPTLSDHVQRFSFYYTVSFSNNDAFSDSSKFTNGDQRVEVTATLASAGLSAAGFIDLILQPNPYEMDGDPPWLSTDLRVFRTLAQGKKFGAQMGNTAADAPAFIKAIIGNLNSGNTGGETFDDNLSADPNVSQLTLSEQEDSKPVFNFAVARVRYVSNNADIPKPPGVRVFFRMFQESSTRMNFEPETYRTISQGGTDKIPGLGVQGGETISIPFFATDRVDTMQVPLSQQHDDANVQSLKHDPGGKVSYAYFGAWLDFNQSGPNRFPIVPVPIDGPYLTLGFPVPTNPVPIMQLVRGHQCLVAEISFDADPIATGDTPFTSDKLAQRNLSIIGSDNPGSPASHRIPNTVDIRPTPSPLAKGLPYDELMIDWGKVPVGSVASIYLPGIDAHEILQMAAEMYGTHRLSFADGHTVQTSTGGATFIPIPHGPAAGFAGLLTIDLPSTVHKGQLFNVVVHQISNTQGVAPHKSAPAPVPKIARSGSPAAVAPAPKLIYWRQVIGTFQIKIPVSTKTLLLPEEERNLSVFRWIAEAIPKNNRWYPVFERYLLQLGERVKSFGGDPAHIAPSPLGNGKPWYPERPGHPGEPGHPGRGEPGREEYENELESVGKVSGLIYDRFGDFEGFLLETMRGEHRRYDSRERAIQSLAWLAWEERLRVAVHAPMHHPHNATRIVLQPPPAHV